MEQQREYQPHLGQFTAVQAMLHVCLQAIEAFQKDPPTTVFLLSMRCGSVGINLTSANYVFILEPALNPALEEQAIGRAWRMGQQRQVTIKKFYVKVSLTGLQCCNDNQRLQGQTLSTGLQTSSENSTVSWSVA